MAHSTYTPEIGKRVADLYGATMLTVKEVCQQNEWAPSDSTLYLWRQKHPEFDAMMEAARKAKAHQYGDKALYLVENEKDPQLLNAKTKTLQWLAKVSNPDRYGEKVQVDVTHTVEMGDALADAHARLLSVCDQEAVEKTQVIDITPLSEPPPTDTQSVDVDDEPDFMK